MLIYTDTITSCIGEGGIEPRGLLLLHAHTDTAGRINKFQIRRLGCLGESIPDKMNETWNVFTNFEEVHVVPFSLDVSPPPV